MRKKFTIKSHEERISLFNEFFNENEAILSDLPRYYSSNGSYKYSEKGRDEVYLKSDLGNHQTPYAYVGIADIPYIIFYTRISKTDSAKTKQKKELLRQKAIQLSKKFIYEHCEYKVFDRLKGKEVAHHEKNFNELENWSIYPTKIKDKDELMESLKFLMMLFHDYLTKEVSKTKKDFNTTEKTCFRTKDFHQSLFLSQDKPVDSKCSKVIIVGPYPTRGFVNSVIVELNPKIVYVVVDESWKPSELEEIGNIKSVQLIQVRTDNGVGIVHAKMYYVEYEKNLKPRTRLFFGSVNASQNSVENNSEFWASFRLSAFKPDDQKQIKKYFHNLVSEKISMVKPRKIQLRNHENKTISILSFPRITKAEKIKSFYNWIRSGSFFVKYEPDSSFGCLSVKLNKEKLPKDKLNELLKGSIFENATLKSELRYSYVNDKDVKPNSEKWKKYTIDTRNGLWLSYECFTTGKDFPPVIHQKAKIIEKLKKFDDEKKDTVVEYFKAEVDKLLKKKELRKMIRPIDTNKLKKKIDNDISLAQNREFKNRYETGYATVGLTTNNSEYLKSIACDFIESCTIKNTKSRVENLMAKTFRNLFGDMSTEEIHDELLNNWDDYKDVLVNYYKKRENKA